MIVLDTTVLVYAVGEDHPLRQPCRELVAALRDRRVRATTTPEVIQEFAHVRSRHGRLDAGDLANDFARLMAPLIVVGEDDLRAGLSLFAEHDRLEAFDAVLAAAGLRRGAVALVSADRAFAAVGQLPYVDPANQDFLTPSAGVDPIPYAVTGTVQRRLPHSSCLQHRPQPVCQWPQPDDPRGALNVELHSSQRCQPRGGHPLPRVRSVPPVAGSGGSGVRPPGARRKRRQGPAVRVGPPVRGRPRHRLATAADGGLTVAPTASPRRAMTRASRARAASASTPPGGSDPRSRQVPTMSTRLRSSSGATKRSRKQRALVGPLEVVEDDDHGRHLPGCLQEPGDAVEQREPRAPRVR